MAGKHYEDFEEGERIVHETRQTVSESDNQRFCDLTMNAQPLHLDATLTAETEFGECVVDALYPLALAVGLSVPDTTAGTAVANLGCGNVEHPAPVFTATPSGRRPSSPKRGRLQTGTEAP